MAPILFTVMEVMTRFEPILIILEVQFKPAVRLLQISFMVVLAMTHCMAIMVITHSMAVLERTPFIPVVVQILLYCV